MQVLQYLRPSTRVLTAKYWSTYKEVLAFAVVLAREQSSNEFGSVLSALPKPTDL